MNLYKLYVILVTLLKKFGFFLYISKSLNKKIIPDVVKISKYRNKCVRYGGNSDGSYFVPDFRYDIVFSPGVSNRTLFESQMINQGAIVFMADYSCKNPKLGKKSYFSKKFLSSLNKDKNHISLENWVEINKKYFPKNFKHCILQCDIEGMEYEVILNTSRKILDFFSVIVIEFHKFHLIHDRFLSSLILSTFEKLRETHIPIHANVNNINTKLISTIEYTFIKKDLFAKEELTIKNILPTKNLNHYNAKSLPIEFIEQ